MANYKRKHPRKHVKCALCTPHRLGNSVQAIKKKYQEIKHTKEIYDSDD